MYLFYPQPNLSAFNDKYECFHQEFFNNPQTSSLTNDTTRHDYYTYTYDAVWTIAKALNETEQELQNRNLGLTLGDYKHLNNNTQIIPDLITEFLNKTNFTGVSVSLNYCIPATYQFYLCVYLSVTDVGMAITNLCAVGHVSLESYLVLVQYTE